MATRLQVNLGERTYPIHIGEDPRAEIARETVAATANGNTAAVLTDENLRRAQPSLFEETFRDLPCLVLPPGETTKSFGHLETVCEFLAGEGLDRGSTLFVAGGGVIGDLGGFAAACYLRGIACVQIPTTLLAMVDSSVGGKTGVNLRAGKNLAGAFHHPRAVFIGTDLLATLPEREFAAGMAEVIKYGLLADAGLFEQLIRLGRFGPDHPELPAIIRRCCEIKAEIVAADETETAAEGGRALLNLGHTFAHAIEQAAGYGDYLHGEAVGLGLVLAARLSQERGSINREEAQLVKELVECHGLPTALLSPLPMSRLIEAMRRDKKVRGGRLRFVGLEAIGKAATWNDVGADLVVWLWKEAGAA